MLQEIVDSFNGNYKRKKDFYKKKNRNLKRSLKKLNKQVSY